MPPVRSLARAILPILPILAAVLLAGALVCGATPALAAGGRAALVIANATYSAGEGPLRNAGDARALADDLKRKGFTVETVEDGTKDGMRAAIERFARGVEPNGIALLYFSGYAVKVNGKNYLLPVDAPVMWSEGDVPSNGIAVDTVLDDLDARRAGIRVVVLDASRRNPFEPNLRVSRRALGLAPISPPPGTLVLYSAAAGGLVHDTTGSRSQFMAELLLQMGVPDQTADKAFAAVREALDKRTRGAQVPFVASNLIETFYFDPDRRRVPVETPRADRPDDTAARDQAAKDQAARDQAARDQAARDRDRAGRDQAARDRAAREQADREQAERDRAERERQAQARDFDAAQAKGTKPAYEEFLDRYGSGPLADKARAEIARIDDERKMAADYDAAQGKDTLAAYEEFLKQHPKGSLADKARARVAEINAAGERRKEEERKRLAALDERIARNRRDEGAYYARGQFHAQRGDAAAAIADFDQAIRLNPANPEAYNNRCWMRALTDDLKRALSDCNEALKLRRDFVDALDSRGLVNLKSGAFRAAIADYDSILSAEPEHASALYGRGFARARLGEKTKAEGDIARARQLNETIEQDFASYGVR